MVNIHTKITGLLQQLREVPGSVGVVAIHSNRGPILSVGEANWYPLASSAKVAIGAVVATQVQVGAVTWDTRIDDLTLDRNEDSYILYPHLQSLNSYTLRDATEIMIACHDHVCANAIANLLGGWDSLQWLVNETWPNIHVAKNPRSVSENTGQLRAMAELMTTIGSGYRKDLELWRPVVSGLVRQADKTEGIPVQGQWNLTGGLPNALMDVGILGDFSASNYVTYAVAGKGLLDRSIAYGADNLLAQVIFELYSLI